MVRGLEIRMTSCIQYAVSGFVSAITCPPVCLCRRVLVPSGGLRALRLHWRCPGSIPGSPWRRILVVRPGTVQVRRASSARSFPRDGRSRGALPFGLSSGAPGAIPLRRFSPMARAAALLPPGPRRGRRSRRRHFRGGVGHRR